MIFNFNKIKNKVFFSFLTIFILFFSFLNFKTTNAQVSGGLNIELSPENPKPGDTYTARVFSYSIDIDKANIIWSIDGQSVNSGFGNKEIKLVKKNKTETLSIKATTPVGDVYSNSKVLGVNNITLIHEGLDSYTPYWYKGKRGLASGGKVRVVAIPNITDLKGNILPKEEISYVWEVNSEIVQTSSGYGKYFADLNIIEEYGNKVLIRVTASPKDSDIKISDSITISPETPKILAFEETGGNIVSTFPLTVFTTNKDNLTVSVEPFFFSTDRNKNTEIEYSWNINSMQANGSYKRTFKFGEQNGYSDIEISVKNSNINKLFQSANTKLRINF